MQELINQLITTGTGLGMLAAAYLVWLITGVANNLFSVKKWSWKRTGEDLLKATLIAIATLLWVAVCYGFNWYITKLGGDVSAIMEGATLLGLLAGIVGGTAWYMKKAFTNIVNFINKNHVEVKLENPGYTAIAEKVSEVVGNFVKHDDSHTVEEITAEKGAFCYYWVNTETPTDFYNAVNGKGFNEGVGYQCVAGFKEFMVAIAGRYVSAGGAAKNYATAQSIVEPLGFTWHAGTAGLQNGDWGIWDTEQYGHAAMYYDGKWFGQNQGAANPDVGNPFNLRALSTSGLVGYYRPNKYNLPSPTPEPQPEPSTQEISYVYKKGDTFGQVVKDLGLATDHGLWSPDGDVEYYTKQLHEQGIYGNVPVGTSIRLTKRPD